MSLSAEAQNKLDAMSELLLATGHLNAKDIYLALQAGRQRMDGQPVGTTNEWSNPRTGNSGAATLLRSFEDEGSQCRF